MDNNPLNHLNTKKLGAVERRWVSELAQFDFQIVCIALVARMWWQIPGRSECVAVAQTFQDTRNVLTVQATKPCVALCQETSASPKHTSMSSLPSFDMTALVSLQWVNPVIASFQILNC